MFFLSQVSGIEVPRSDVYFFTKAVIVFLRELNSQLGKGVRPTSHIID